MVARDPLDVLDQLDRRGVRAVVTAGRLRTIGPAGVIDDDLAGDVRRLRDLIIAVLVGRTTGHAWAPCSTCREGTLTPILDSQGKPRKTWPTCRMTPHCPGRHEPDPTELGRVSAVPPPAQPTPPARPPRQRLFGERPPWPMAEPRGRHD